MSSVKNSRSSTLLTPVMRNVGLKLSILVLTTWYTTRSLLVLYDTIISTTPVEEVVLAPSCINQ